MRHMFTITSRAFSIDCMGTNSNLPWKFSPPAKMLGQGRPLNESCAPSVPPRIGCTGTEVISADSRQIYKGIPVVTAMPSPEELAVVKHHLIDMLPLDAYYSAARFEEDALAIAEKLIERNGSAIVCGGSMMYVDALCNGIDMLPTVPDSIRHDLEKEFEKKGGDWLREKLRLLDPEYYGIVDLCNTKRVFHAIEIILASGKTYTELRTGKKRKRPFRIKKYMTDLPREVLFDRINRRVDIMLENGLEEEARAVYHMRHLNSLNTVGLKEMFAWFEGTMKILMVWCRKIESVTIFRIIKSIDEDAFVTQGAVNGVYGKGFDKVKIKMKKQKNTDSRTLNSLPENPTPVQMVRRSNQEE